MIGVKARRTIVASEQEREILASYTPESCHWRYSCLHHIVFTMVALMLTPPAAAKLNIFSRLLERKGLVKGLYSLGGSELQLQQLSSYISCALG